MGLVLPLPIIPSLKVTGSYFILASLGTEIQEWFSCCEKGPERGWGATSETLLWSGRRECFVPCVDLRSYGQRVAQDLCRDIFSLSSTVDPGGQWIHFFSFLQNVHQHHHVLTFIIRNGSASGWFAAFCYRWNPAEEREEDPFTFSNPDFFSLFRDTGGINPFPSVGVSYHLC